MIRMVRLAAAALILGTAGTVEAGLPGEVKEWRDFPVSEAADFPGVMAADGLLEKKAGKAGAIVVKGGHFYTSLVDGKRIRFLGVNFCFSACFPAHEEADRVAVRLSRLGINAVRFHHMDSAPFPNGIFKEGDSRLEELDPVAMDRLDYFIFALKKNGVYADLNLHVSRWYTKAHKMAGAEKTPGMDKIIDLFYPDLIEAQKTYAKDLLTHVNAYTKNAYSDEPAVCMVEINNENTFFMWDGEQVLAGLPEPYAGTLRGLWNEWLTEKYGSRERLAGVWNAGAEPVGKNLLRDVELQAVGKAGSAWVLEQHEGAAMTAEAGAGGRGVVLKIEKVTGTSWHLQFKQAGLAVKKGQFYTVKFRGSAEGERRVDVTVGQDHADYQGLGLSGAAELTKEPKDFVLHFTASADDDDARLSFGVGQKVGSVMLSDITLATGGQEGLAGEEDPVQGSVRLDGGAGAAARRARDWYDFLQHQDQAYFTEMYRYLREELHLHTPITGTIGMGALGAMSQAKMDFVDAHAYWDHPQFPGKPWDAKNWRIRNAPMVDSPEGSTFGGLAAIRVSGKPFTVTEYNEGAPNEWQAECVPMIATFAALQDWDAVYLFAYSHDGQFEKDYADNYFDVKGNLAKLYFLPAAARIFLGENVAPLPAGAPVVVTREESLGLAERYYFQLSGQLRETAGVTADSLLRKQLAISFSAAAGTAEKSNAAVDQRVSWTASGAGTGQFALQDSGARVFVGFLRKGQEVELGPVGLSNISVPFLAATVVPADVKSVQGKPAEFLLTVMGRTRNTGMEWNAARTTVGVNWGKGPTQIEPVRADLRLPAGWEVVPVDSAGKPAEGLKGNGPEAILTGETCWYVLRRK